MALPVLAAVGAAAGSAALQYVRSQIQKNVSRAQGMVSAAAALSPQGLMSAAGGFAASQVLSTGQGNVIPFVPSPAQFRAGLDKLPAGVSSYIAQNVAPSGVGAAFTIGARKRYRRMNVANVKALRRAGRRVEGFVKLAKSLITIPGARAKHPIKSGRRR